MTPSGHFWQLWLPLSLAGCILLSLIITVARETLRKHGKGTKLQKILSERRDLILTSFACLILGFVCGRLYEAYHQMQVVTAVQHLVDEETRADLTVLRSYDDYNVLVKFNHGDDHHYKWSFCSDSPVHLESGQRIVWIRYDQEPSCKSLRGRNLGIQLYTDEETGEVVKFPIKEGGSL